jgi:hypothetical protein
MQPWIFDSDDPHRVRRLWRKVDLAAIRGTAFPEPGPEPPDERLGDVLRALASAKISYGWEPADEPAPNSQRVRTPQAILERNERATCIDLSLLAAACLLKAGIHPFIVVGTKPGAGHAWVVADLGPSRRFPASPKKTSSEQEFPGWETRQGRDRSGAPVEAAELLQLLVEHEPERYRSIEVTRLTRGQPGEPSKKERVRRALAEGATAFEHWDELEVCDVGWWWDGAWVLESPDDPPPTGGAPVPDDRPSIRSLAAAGDRTRTAPVVLIVDDDDAEVLAGVLLTYRRILATDPEGAATVIDDHEQQIDVAIVDMVLGGQDDLGQLGRGVLTHLNQVRPELPTIGVSRSFNFGDLERDESRYRELYAVQRIAHKPRQGAPHALADLVQDLVELPPPTRMEVQVQRVVQAAQHSLRTRSGGRGTDLEALAAIGQAQTEALAALHDLTPSDPTVTAAAVAVLRDLEHQLDRIRAG